MLELDSIDLYILLLLCSFFLSAAKASFLDLGLEVQGEWKMEGEWLDRLLGLTDVKTFVGQRELFWSWLKKSNK